MDSKNRMKLPWSVASGEVLKETDSGKAGLTPDSVKQKLEDYGLNLLKSKDVLPWYVIFIQQFANPLVYMLIAAAAVKAYLKGPLDAGVIAAVLIFMAVIGFIQEYKAQKAMTALMKLSVPKAKVRRGGEISAIDAEELVPGDILILDAGDRIAGDARLLETANFRVNESAFTGESMPVEKQTDPVPENSSIHDRSNMVFMGTTVSSGRAAAVVTATGMNTEIGRIADAIRETKKEKTPLQHSVEKLGHALIWIVLGVCTMLAIAGMLQGMTWIDVILLAVAAAVSGIPEGLPAAVTVVLSICVNKMAGRNVIIRKLSAVETLGSTTVICSDKTGTLTLNQMTVKNIWINGKFIDVAGTGYEPMGDFSCNGRKISHHNDLQLQRILSVSALCNDAILNGTGVKWDIIGDPTEGALLTAAHKAGIIKSELEKNRPRLGEIPFESDKQYMATLHSENGRRTVYVKGSVEKILSLSGFFGTGQKDKPLNREIRKEILDANAKMALQAQRVLAVAVAPYPVELGKLNHANISGRLVFLGLIGMIDPPRDEARSAIRACKSAGIRVAMITGDNPLTASAIAAQLSICGEGDKALSGYEIEKMSDDELLEICRKQNVYARIEPLHKLRIVNAFKRDGHITAMTGDGVNDAPALESAGIGIAMGITGTDVAKEAADMVLADDNFASIVSAVEEGRIVFNRLRNVVFFLLMTCASELLLLFLSVAFYGESPLEPIQILWINMIVGSMAAIPLGLEPGTGRELNQEPRDVKVGLIFPGMVFRLAFAALIMGGLITWVFHHTPLPAGADPAAAHKIRQTIAFSSIVFFEWFFAFQARQPEEGILKAGLFRNPWLIVSMLTGLSLQLAVIYLPFANLIFKTHPLDLNEFAWVLLPGITVFLLEELRKKFFPKLFSLGQWRRIK